MNSDEKREVVANIREFHGTTDPTPFYEICFIKNVRAGEKLELDPTADVIYRYVKRK